MACQQFITEDLSAPVNCSRGSHAGGFCIQLELPSWLLWRLSDFGAVFALAARLSTDVGAQATLLHSGCADSLVRFTSANQAMERRLSSLQACTHHAEPNTGLVPTPCEAVALSFSRQVSPVLSGLTSYESLMTLAYLMSSEVPS